MPVMGLDPAWKGDMEPVYRAALALGTANQLTNILRDVGEDASQRNRIYLPLDELDEFGISEKDVLRGMFSAAEAGADKLHPEARWPVWTALILYRGILDQIEANGYDNFTKRAYVSKTKKLAYL